MKLYMVATLSFFILLMAMVVLDTAPAFAEKKMIPNQRKRLNCVVHGEIP